MRNLVAEVIADPQKIAVYNISDWDLLVRQARNSELLGRIYIHLRNHQLLQQVPEIALKHLHSANTQTTRHAELVLYEVNQIYSELSQLETPVVLLKGAAYVAARIPAGEGRIFTDIDVMVHKSQITLAEDALQYAGWVSSNTDPYDQKYYRKWMHEIPPMKHGKRKTVLDLHHAILPETARLHPETIKLFKAAVPVEGYSNLYTLCPEDMVLHSATHLFHDGEFEHGLRDLVDLDSLLRYFPTKNPKFWERLVGRARNIDLVRPLYYALLYCRNVLNTPIPSDIFEQARKQAEMSSLMRGFMNQLLSRGLMPNHPSCQGAFSGLLMWLLYVRSHYLRMPFHLLIPHLVHKAVITPYNEYKKEQEKARNPTIQQILAQGNIIK